MKPKIKNKVQQEKTEGAEKGFFAMGPAAVTDGAPRAAGPGGPQRPTPGSGEYKIVPRGLIRPDPNQPRKDFSEESLREMAVSIYLQGIIQPLVVKYMAPELKIIEPDMVNGKLWQALRIADGAVVFESKEEVAVRAFAEGKTNEFYQLIAGERRWRSTIPRELEIEGKAIEWPGLKELPVMIRVADDQDTYALQHMENQKRVNLTALEEAQSFGEELARRQAVDPTFTAERLGFDLGVKKGTAYSRMKLLRLKPAVRAALVAGKIEVAHALAIAAVPDVKRQEELLEQVQTGDHYTGEIMSSRALMELIDDEYVKQLKDAPFDKADEKLVPTAWCVRAGDNEMFVEGARKPGIPNLKTIGTPKAVLTGSLRLEDYGKFCVVDGSGYDLTGPLPKKQAKELVEFLILPLNIKAAVATVTQTAGWACVTCPHRSGVMDPETKTPNVCTLPSCFDAKVKAHWVKKSEELIAKGTVVLTEGAVRKLGKHIPEDRYEYSHGSTFKELMGKHAPEPVLVATKEGIKKFYPEEEAIAAAKKNGNKIHSQSQGKSAEEKAKEEAAEKKREELKKSREALADELWDDVAKALVKVGDRDAWEFLDQKKVEHWGYEARPLKVLIEGPKTAKARVLGRHFAHRDLRLVHYNGEWDKETLSAYAKIGIDVLAIEKQRAKDKQPAKELPLKTEPKQKTLIEVKQKGPKKMSATQKGGIAAAAKARWAKAKAAVGK